MQGCNALVEGPLDAEGARDCALARAQKAGFRTSHSSPTSKAGNLA
jgi:hypothetical protein